MVKAMILVPVKDNDGRPLGRDAWQELQQRLLEFGGYTDAGRVAGAWESEGRVYHDENRQFIIALGSWRDVPRFLELAEWVRVRFRQEAVYIEIAGVPEILGG
ncbi:MAG: hypothetical protein DIU69_12090 [Bacillota bacterium]|nr:MAG: hypothetical protein DIU69_12090 [Bacillota bacterium]